MNITEKIKEKSIGAYIMAAGALLALVVTIMYLAFGLSSNEFVGGIFVCFLLGFVLSAAVLFYEGIPTDLIAFAAVVLLSVALGMFISNSINDFADFISNMPLFGNMDNAGMRIVIIVFTCVDIIAVIVANFFKRTKKTA